MNVTKIIRKESDFIGKKNLLYKYNYKNTKYYSIKVAN